MTLATKIIILQPAPVKDLYQVLDAMVNPTGNPSIVREEPGGIHNQIGQSNRSMLNITRAIDGPIDEQVEARAEAERYPNDTPWPGYAPVPYCIKVGLDTGYGYNEDGIGSCNDLHAAIIMATYAWAAERNAEIMWYNEYKGEWSYGLDGLDEFAANGAEAQACFHGMVKPAMESQGMRII